MIEATTEWVTRFATLLAEEQSASDAPHDEEHVWRVVANAKKLAGAEGGSRGRVTGSVLHDCVVIPKNSPLAWMRTGTRLWARWNRPHPDYRGGNGTPFYGLSEPFPVTRRAMIARASSTISSPNY